MRRHGRWSMLLLCLVLPPAVLLSAAQKQDETTSPARNPVEGAEIFRYYCAACHGTNGKGTGPAAASMKAAPTDLTQLAKKNDGKYPANHIAAVLKFGSGPGVHGSADMPVWGPLFKSLDKFHDATVQQRVSNLVGYIETLQAK